MTTTVLVQQIVGATLSVASAVEPSLSSDYWSGPSSPVSVPDGPQIEALWMDRDVGIKEGHAWVFTSSVDVGGTAVLLQEQVIGTALSSTIAIQVQAGGQSTDWQQDNAALKFTAQDGNSYQVTGEFYLPAGSDYDNVLYSIQPA
ncbi:hypothetical protein [Lysobacter fragariae]